MDPLNKRLAKLMPMLSSNQPNEVTAAVFAIGRVLKGAEKDWHYVASLIEGQTKLFGGDTIENAVLRGSNHNLQRQVGSLSTEVSVLKATVASLRRKLQEAENKAKPKSLAYNVAKELLHFAPLNYKESGFLSTLRDAINKNPDYKMSSAQKDLFIDIWEKYEKYTNYKMDNL